MAKMEYNRLVFRILLCMVKANLKNIAISLVILSVVIVLLTVIDGTRGITVSQSDTYLRVTVVDLQDNPIHNAKISIGTEGYYTDNNGLSPAIKLVSPQNSYDSAITKWHTVNVTVQKEGYVAAVVINCVVYDAQTRRLTVRIYPNDSSNLPYVCYVESPPNEYVQQLLDN